ncbi:DNA-binding protein [Bacillus methanolicus]|uniref:helix-turn-helix domain-containing protein n=1 Tax=Bacillus methanolicus TaxID=1471 RepID=UPI00200C8F5E|nr:helix-turn-helix domain-containing protein [Bacillus methanolicus]UQD51350.1 DNA-binding protein [Bacillus methanolicus]
MENIQKIIAKNLKMIRKTRGISLDRAAEATGVSKAMLSQIERGESNPTVTTLWKIATGLQVSFSSIIREEPSEVVFVSMQDVDPVIENNGEYRVYSIFPFDPRKKFEIYIIELDPGCCHVSDPHNEGIEEYITVMSGCLKMKINSETFLINAGSSIRFTANKPHTYSNPGADIVRYQLVMYYP